MYPQLEVEGLGKPIFVILILGLCFFGYLTKTQYDLFNENKKEITEIGKCDKFGWCKVKFADGTSRDAAFPVIGEKVLYYINRSDY